MRWNKKRWNACISQALYCSILSMLVSCVTTEKNPPPSNEYVACLQEEGKYRPLTEKEFDSCDKFLPKKVVIEKGAKDAPKGLSRDEIAAVLEVNTPQVRNCYSQELRQSATAKGTVTVEFEIDEQGAIKNVNLEKNNMSKHLANCVVRVVKQMHYPKPRGATEIKVHTPFQFNPY